MTISNKTPVEGHANYTGPTTGKGDLAHHSDGDGAAVALFAQPTVLPSDIHAMGAVTANASSVFALPEIP